MARPELLHIFVKNWIHAVARRALPGTAPIALTATYRYYKTNLVKFPGRSQASAVKVFPIVLGE